MIFDLTQPSWFVVEDTLISGVREILGLARLHHPNILHLRNLVLSSSSIFVSFEECLTDLGQMVDNLQTPLSEPQVIKPEFVYNCML